MHGTSCPAKSVSDSISTACGLYNFKIVEVDACVILVNVDVCCDADPLQDYFGCKNVLNVVILSKLWTILLYDAWVSMTVF